MELGEEEQEEDISRSEVGIWDWYFMIYFIEILLNDL